MAAEEELVMNEEIEQNENLEEKILPQVQRMIQESQTALILNISSRFKEQL